MQQPPVSSFHPSYLKPVMINGRLASETDVITELTASGICLAERELLAISSCRWRFSEAEGLYRPVLVSLYDIGWQSAIRGEFFKFVCDRGLHLCPKELVPYILLDIESSSHDYFHVAMDPILMPTSRPFPEWPKAEHEIIFGVWLRAGGKQLAIDPGRANYCWDDYYRPWIFCA